MRKKILLMLSLFCFVGATMFAQTIEGGAGVIHVVGDPNLNPDLIDVDVNEGNVAYDNNAQTAYFFNPAGTAYDPIGAPATPGTQWVAVDITGLVDPITNILTPETELTTTIVNGVATIEFESDATISFDPATNELTFTDVDDDDTVIDISGATVVDAADPSITVAGDGTTGDPYSISITGADVDGNDGFVPVTDGDGNLTWTNVVQSATITDGTGGTVAGQIQLTFTDGTTSTLDLSDAPKVENVTELNAAATALPSGTSGIAIADEHNTFGLPATSSVGVIFFISN